MCLGTNADSRLKSRVLGKVVAYGDECLGNESVGKREDEIATLPTGNQVVHLQNEIGITTQQKKDGIIIADQAADRR